MRSYPSDDSPLLSTREAALFFNLSPKTLKGWRLLGKGPRYTILERSKSRRLIKYRLADLQEFSRKWVQDPMRVKPAAPTAIRHVMKVKPARKNSRRTNKQDKFMMENLDSVIAALQKDIKKAGSKLAWCKENNLTLGSLAHAVSGRQPISPRIADALGFDYVVIVRYVKRPKQTIPPSES